MAKSPSSIPSLHLIIQPILSSLNSSYPSSSCQPGIKRSIITKIRQENSITIVHTRTLVDTSISNLDEFKKERDALYDTSHALMNRLIFLKLIPTTTHRSISRLISLTAHQEPSSSSMSPVFATSCLADVLAGVAEPGFEGLHAILIDQNVASRLSRVNLLLQNKLQVLKSFPDPRNPSSSNQTSSSSTPPLTDLTSSSTPPSSPSSTSTSPTSFSHSSSPNNTETESEEEGMARRIKEANFPEHVRKEAEKELSRFSRLSPISMERGMLQSYLDWLLQVPWLKESSGSDDYLNAMKLSQARSQLDGDHCGLEGVKERIIQYLAVLKLRARVGKECSPPSSSSSSASPPVQAPILCLIGPPGVGKTSLGRSVAKALNRPFSRVSLGGVRDEAEIRGHRRTYVSSLPGTIVREICRCQAKDPIMLLGTS